MMMEPPRDPSHAVLPPLTAPTDSQREQQKQLAAQQAQAQLERRRRRKHEKEGADGPTSLFLFTPTSPIRRLATWIINTWVFEWTVILTILANCGVMALDSKLANDDRTALSIWMVKKLVPNELNGLICGREGCVVGTRVPKYRILPPPSLRTCFLFFDPAFFTSPRPPWLALARSPFLPALLQLLSRRGIGYSRNTKTSQTGRMRNASIRESPVIYLLSLYSIPTTL